MDNITDVTVIIPTMAEEKRHASLLRAIASTSGAMNRSPHIVVVVNGNRRSPDVENSLRNIGHVELLSQEIASLPLALLAGRRAVKTRYFCFLDDDDEYLPGAIEARIAALAGDEDADFVVTNGYVFMDGVDRRLFDNLHRTPAAPFVELFRQNWLASCGALFYSERVGTDYFEDMHSYAEWTWLAFKLCMGNKKMTVLDQLTFRIYDTPGSTSKSTSFSEAPSLLYRKMLDENPPKPIISMIRQHIGDDFHNRADLYCQQGRLKDAWKAHIKSIFYPGGWRYLPFFRHLILRRKGGGE